MHVADAQREVRTTYLGGAPGGIVSGLLWLVSAACATWGTRPQAIWVLVLGGPLIFPLTQLLLKATGRRASLSHENPFGGLAMQIAFTIPLSLPVIAAATLARPGWFYPGFMVIVGAHYLPFIFLYGMRSFALLAAVLFGGGMVIGMRMSDQFAIGGWFTAAVLLLWGIVCWVVFARGDKVR
jgi:hypothetical protein